MMELIRVLEPEIREWLGGSDLSGVGRGRLLVFDPVLDESCLNRSLRLTYGWWSWRCWLGQFWDFSVCDGQLFVLRKPSRFQGWFECVVFDLFEPGSLDDAECCIRRIP